jgi:hypothetical protein
MYCALKEQTRIHKEQRWVTSMLLRYLIGVLIYFFIVSSTLVTFNKKYR